MKYLCGRCIHIDVCLVPRSIGCVEECKHFKEMPSHLPKQTNEEYLRYCTTEQLAEWIVNLTLLDKYKLYDQMESAEYEHGIGVGAKKVIVEWLKQPHK